VFGKVGTTTIGMETGTVAFYVRSASTGRTCKLRQCNMASENAALSALLPASPFVDPVRWGTARES
jgi:hypothetical protein